MSLLYIDGLVKESGNSSALAWYGLIHSDLYDNPHVPCCLTVRGSGITAGYIVCNTLGASIHFRMRSILQALLCQLLATIYPILAPAMGELAKEITNNTVVDIYSLSRLVIWLGCICFVHVNIMKVNFKLVGTISYGPLQSWLTIDHT